jgi:hypothetical protein
VRLQISTARKALVTAWAVLKELLKPAEGEHRLHVYQENGGTAATCTCVDSDGSAWYFWHESPLIAAQQVHLHLLSDELIYPQPHL